MVRLSLAVKGISGTWWILRKRLIGKRNTSLFICKYLLQKETYNNILNINVRYLQFEKEELNLNENHQFP